MSALKSDSTADADKCRNPPDHPVNGRIQQFLERMHRTRVEVFDESNRKRPAPSEPTDGLDQAKRQRLAAEPPSRTPSVQPLPPGEVSWRQLYTLNAEGSTANFDVQNFRDPEQLLRIVVPVLQSVNPQKLEQAINVCDVPFPTCRPPVGLRCTILLFNTNSASTCQL
jgi:symplekin